VRLPEPDARQRFASAPVARLATAGPDGRPHLVPVTFVLDSRSGPGDRIYTVVDAKPKTTTNLQRLRNIRANPQVAALADHYQRDWAGLWWVRADGHADILEEPADMAAALALLAGRYPQYQQQPPGGPVIRIQVARWTGWAAAAD
jgi:PPOX class probable F420-dependent enzyme